MIQSHKELKDTVVDAERLFVAGVCQSGHWDRLGLQGRRNLDSAHLAEVSMFFDLL